MENLDFGNKLVVVRKQKGLTQGEVAEKCNVTLRTIQRIESGVVNPRASTIKIISKTLGFDYFETSNTDYGEKKESQLLKLKICKFLWDVKDLFNLKTYTMKKISILTLSALMITFGLYAINPNQKEIKNDNSITTIYNKDKTLKYIEVKFSNKLTLDSLTNIKSTVENFDIKINYKKIVFDESNHLQELSCEAFTELGSGSFYEPSLDSRMAGFYCNYSKNAEDIFCIGTGCIKQKKK